MTQKTTIKAEDASRLRLGIGQVRAGAVEMPSRAATFLMLAAGSYFATKTVEIIWGWLS